jgi:hypothetical protein
MNPGNVSCELTPRASVVVLSLTSKPPPTRQHSILSGNASRSAARVRGCCTHRTYSTTSAAGLLYSLLFLTGALSGHQKLSLVYSTERGPLQRAASGKSH